MDRVTRHVQGAMQAEFHNAATQSVDVSSDIAVLDMQVIHQCVAFGLFVTPVYFIWEKLIGETSSQTALIACPGALLCLSPAS